VSNATAKVSLTGYRCPELLKLLLDLRIIRATGGNRAAELDLRANACLQ
jgi:hypothetical protein